MKLVLSLVLALVVACKSDESGARKPPANGIEVLAEGAMPRRLLRYSLAKGSTSSVELALDMNLNAGTQGGAIPTVTMTFDTTVEEVLPTGQMKVRMTVGETGARDRPDSPVPAAATASPLDALKGLAIVGVLSPDGKLEGAHPDLGDKKLPELQAAQIDSVVANFEHVTMALPDTMVGVGAKWKSARPIEQNGMKLTAVNTVELTKIEGNTISFSTHSEIHGADQTVTQAGMAIKIEHIAGTGEGQGSIDLAKLAMAGELSATFKAEMSAQNEHTPMEVTTKLTMTPK